MDEVETLFGKQPCKLGLTENCPDPGDLLDKVDDSATKLKLTPAAIKNVGPNGIKRLERSDEAIFGAQSLIDEGIEGADDFLNHTKSGMKKRKADFDKAVSEGVENSDQANNLSTHIAEFDAIKNHQTKGRQVTSISKKVEGTEIDSITFEFGQKVINEVKTGGPKSIKATQGENLAIYAKENGIKKIRYQVERVRISGK